MKRSTPSNAADIIAGHPARVSGVRIETGKLAYIQLVEYLVTPLA